MKWTKSPRIAMERLADVLGWQVKSAGGAWRITFPPTFEGLSFTALEALCIMTRVATAPREWDGLALSPVKVREEIRYRPKHIRDPKCNSGYTLSLPVKIRGLDEATIYRTYFNPEETS